MVIIFNTFQRPFVVETDNFKSTSQSVFEEKKHTHKNLKSLFETRHFIEKILQSV